MESLNIPKNSKTLPQDRNSPNLTKIDQCRPKWTKIIYIKKKKKKIRHRSLPNSHKFFFLNFGYGIFFLLAINEKTDLPIKRKNISLFDGFCFLG